MENPQDFNKDGLESFFQERLSGFQDEPSFDMWERIEAAIPEKPKKKRVLLLRPVLSWTSGAVAACLILTLGFLNLEYQKRLDTLASKLEENKNSYDTLADQLNNFQQLQQENKTLAQAVSKQLDSKKDKKPTKNRVNARPSVPKVQPDMPTKVVYVDRPVTVYKAKEEIQHTVARPVVQTGLRKPTRVANSPMLATRNKVIDQTQRIRKSTSTTFQPKILAQKVATTDVLNLKNRGLNKHYNVQLAKLKPTSTRLNYVDNPINRIATVPTLSNDRVVNFQDEELVAAMSGLSTRSKVLNTQTTNPMLSKAVVGTNVNIARNFSLFMKSENLDPMHQMTSQNTTVVPSRYANLGISSGVKYNF